MSDTIGDAPHAAARGERITQRVRDRPVHAYLRRAVTVVDQLVGEAFEREVAELCGLSGNWLQMAYEGPDLAAFGAFDTDPDWRWETVQVEDTWAARLNTTVTGGPPAWEIPCDVTGFVGALAVIDRDIAFDDPVGSIRLDLAIPDGAVCGGWGFYPGAEGIAGVLVRLDVVGATPVCP